MIFDASSPHRASINLAKEVHLANLREQLDQQKQTFLNLAHRLATAATMLEIGADAGQLPNRDAKGQLIALTVAQDAQAAWERYQITYEQLSAAKRQQRKDAGLLVTGTEIIIERGSFGS